MTFVLIVRKITNNVNYSDRNHLEFEGWEVLS